MVVACHKRWFQTEPFPKPTVHNRFTSMTDEPGSGPRPSLIEASQWSRNRKLPEGSGRSLRSSAFEKGRPLIAEKPGLRRRSAASPVQVRSPRRAEKAGPAGPPPSLADDHPDFLDELSGQDRRETSTRESAMPQGRNFDRPRGILDDASGNPWSILSAGRASRSTHGLCRAPGRLRWTFTEA